MQTNLLWLNIKREFWEYRFWMLAMPSIFGAFLIVVAAIAGVFDYGDQIGSLDLSDTTESEVRVLDFGSDAKPLSEQIDADNTEDPSVATDVGNNRVEISVDDDSYAHVLMIFIGLGWIIAFFYSLSSLHSDRKDHSILFWKSLPISDTQVVLSKFVFATVGFSVVALAIGWVFCIVITIIGWIFGWDHIIHAPGSLLEFLYALIVPPITIVIGVVRGLPLLGFAFLASAVAKRSPLMAFAVPIIALSLLELWLLRSTYFVQWLLWHLPINAIQVDANLNNVQFNWPQSWLDPLLLVVGATIAAASLYAAIWLRKYRFEI